MIILLCCCLGLVAALTAKEDHDIILQCASLCGHATNDTVETCKTKCADERRHDAGLITHPQEYKHTIKAVLKPLRKHKGENKLDKKKKDAEDKKKKQIEDKKKQVENKKKDGPEEKKRDAPEEKKDISEVKKDEHKEEKKKDEPKEEKKTAVLQAEHKAKKPVYTIVNGRRKPVRAK